MEKNPELTKLANGLAKNVFGLTMYEAHQQGVCVSCKKPIFYSPTQKAEKEGHIYSVAGQNEYRITALCEYCFDKAFEIPEDYKIDPDQWESEDDKNN